MVRASIVPSPPPSPSILLNAQLIVAKADEAKLKTRKSKALKATVKKEKKAKKLVTTAVKESVPAVNEDDSDVEVMDASETVKYVHSALSTL